MVALYTFLQKITITDLADLQHLLTCNNNLVFKAGRAYMKLVREIVR